MSKQCFIELPRNRLKHGGMEQNRRRWSLSKHNSLVNLDSHSAEMVSVFINKICCFVTVCSRHEHRNVSVNLTIHICPFALFIWIRRQKYTHPLSRSASGVFRMKHPGWSKWMAAAGVGTWQTACFNAPDSPVRGTPAYTNTHCAPLALLFLSELQTRGESAPPPLHCNLEFVHKWQLILRREWRESV